LRFALKFAYDGKGFFGYSRQPNLKTVEGEILKILIKNEIIDDTKKSFFRSASRTDKGVSAFCNVVSFNSPFSKNQIIDILSDGFEDIVFYGIANVNKDFNPRYAKFRHYRYYLQKKNFEFEKIIKTTMCFIGKHDFSNFARVEEFKNPIREIENIVLTEHNSFLIIDFFAQTFLWQQIRRIVSTIEKVSLKKITIREVVDALANPDKNVDFGVASADYLILKDMFFDIEFVYNKRQLSKLKRLQGRIISSFSHG